VLRLLAKAGLVRSVEGAGGGTTLARRVDEITLTEVFQAVERGELFGVPRKDPNPMCPVGRCVQTILGGHLARVEDEARTRASGATPEYLPDFLREE
jgi:DNA-binding IscR family transcriptional regulator